MGSWDSWRTRRYGILLAIILLKRRVALRKKILVLVGAKEVNKAESSQEEDRMGLILQILQIM